MADAEHAPEANGGAEEVVEITRYPNRRLYDRSRGKYVTLSEVADTVRQGKTVAVRDSKTGEDLTRSLLTQIILEQYPERMKLFPVRILHSMIRANAVVLGFLRDYFLQSLTYLDVLQRPAANPFLPSLDWMRFFVPNLAGPARAGEPAAASPGLDAQALAQRVAELEQRLNQLDPGRKKAGGRGPSRRKRAERDTGQADPPPS